MPKVEVLEYITKGAVLDEDKLHATVNCKCGNQISEIGWEWAKCNCGRSYCLTDDERIVMWYKPPAPKVQDMRVTVKVREG